MSLSPVLSLSPEFYSFFFHMPFETWQVHDYRIGYIYCAFALKVYLDKGRPLRFLWRSWYCLRL